jgi:hypothetical protein
MFLLVGLLGFSAVVSGVSITASDLPECAVECYCEASGSLTIPITDYEAQCRSAPFQKALRDCGKKTCNDEEFAFVQPDLHQS